MKLLQECLESIKLNSCPKTWTKVDNILELENSHFRKILNSTSARVYGANSRVGHRDNEIVDIDKENLLTLNHDLLKSHILGSSPWYSEYTAKCISYAKIYTLASGGSGISLELYNILLKCMKDPSFKPQIPQNCTYSSGDVIPGAHWVSTVLEYAKINFSYADSSGDVMALMNGAYVHIGYSLSIIKDLHYVWSLFIETTRLNNRLVGANKSNFYLFSNESSSQDSSLEAVLYISEYVKSNYSDYLKQDPISVRSSSQLVRTLIFSIRSFCEEIDLLLGQPSGNPLFSLNVDYPLSQSSFLAPSLSIKTEGVIEAILFAMWASIGRTKHLLSGDIDSIPCDAANQKSQLQFIQYPKLMQSILEKCRQNYGRRVFASGGETSKGIEDLWTYGVNTTSQLEELCFEFCKILSIELYVLVKVMEIFELGRYEYDEVWNFVAQKSDLVDIVEQFRSLLESGLFKDSSEIFATCIGVSV